MGGRQGTPWTANPRPSETSWIYTEIELNADGLYKLDLLSICLAYLEPEKLWTRWRARSTCRSFCRRRTRWTRLFSTPCDCWSK
ncbi:hypothetical protein ATANTOWER_004430, partial [Ataeniobius toweri]|nr:hypothetical protein [Ataeniobius toweri]